MSCLPTASRRLAPLAASALLSLLLVAGAPASAPAGLAASDVAAQPDRLLDGGVLALSAGSPPDPVPASSKEAPGPDADPLDGPAPLPLIDFVADPMAADPLDAAPAGADSVAADPLDAAPFEVDPLDIDVEPPLGPAVAEQPYDAVGSERSRDAAGALRANDGDPTTVELLDGRRPTASFDLGQVRPVAEIRWLQAGDVPVVVQRSLLGGVWVTVDRVQRPEPGVWQTLEVDWPARYVRLRFDPEADDAARLAEVKVYGPAGEDDWSRPRADPNDGDDQESDAARSTQRARGEDQTDRPERPDRQNRRDRRSSGEPSVQQRSEDAPDRAAEAGRTEGGQRPDRGLDIETDGRADVVTEDCGDGTGDCRITVDVSAGTATCDESGGSGNRAVGRNASAGEGGTCSKDASGGSVEIGDINP